MMSMLVRSVSAHPSWCGLPIYKDELLFSLNMGVRERRRVPYLEGNVGLNFLGR